MPRGESGAAAVSTWGALWGLGTVRAALWSVRPLSASVVVSPVLALSRSLTTSSCGSTSAPQLPRIASTRSLCTDEPITRKASSAAHGPRAARRDALDAAAARPRASS